MTNETIKALYASNKDFKTYVDKYVEHYQFGASISVNEAFTHRIVREVAQQYAGR